MEPASVEVIVVTGLSGAGKSVTLKALEDSGYYCIDNLPVSLIESFLKTIPRDGGIKKIGIGLDVREKEFFKSSYGILARLKSAGGTAKKKPHSVEILFLEADDDVIIRRYNETRRPHPMVSISGKRSIEIAVGEERRLLSEVRESADRIIDTSNFTPHQLRQLITTTYGRTTSKQRLRVTLLSFGYKFGVPQNLDLLFDVRFLPNPYFVPELKPLRGTDPPVSSFVMNQEETHRFFGHVLPFLDFLIPLFIREGKTYLVIGVGCTGGKHRSPVIVEEVKKHLREHHDLDAVVIDRDMEK
jgi:UPF0042 nucleotide-binding protein